MSQYTKEQLDYICRTAARQFAKDNESVIQAVMKCSSFHTNVYVRTYRAGAENCTVDVPENCTFVTATAIFMSDFVQSSVYATCFIPDDCTYDSSFKSVAYQLYEGGTRICALSTQLGRSAGAVNGESLIKLDLLTNLTPKFPFLQTILLTNCAFSSLRLTCTSPLKRHFKKMLTLQKVTMKFNVSGTYSNNLLASALEQLCERYAEQAADDIRKYRKPRKYFKDVNEADLEMNRMNCKSA